MASPKVKGIAVSPAPASLDRRLVLLLAIACGPALLRALRRVRTTPGLPFLVGAGLAVGFAVVSGLSRGEVEDATNGEDDDG